MKTAVALGSFDGLHAGHRAVIEKTVGVYSVAVTFAVPPKCTAAGEGMLMTVADKNAALKNLGVNEICELDFEKVKNTGPDRFLKEINDKYSPALISCGFNYRFGKNAAGDTEYLARFCAKNGIEFYCVPPVSPDGEVISSSRIRALIKEGCVEQANRYLYKPFGFTADVIHGDRRGRTINFPTANQMLPPELLKPRFGVYESSVTLGEKTYKAVTNIGIRPTFKADAPLAETFIIDFDGSVYGKKLSLSLKRFLRAETKFSGLEELKAAIKNDVSEVTK